MQPPGRADRSDHLAEVGLGPRASPGGAGAEARYGELPRPERFVGRGGLLTRSPGRCLRRLRRTAGAGPVRIGATGVRAVGVGARVVR